MMMHRAVVCLTLLLVLLLFNIGNVHGVDYGEGGTEDYDHDDNDEEHDEHDDYAEESCTADGVCEQEEPECDDTYEEECPEWAKEGECKENPQFMLRACQQSCESCGPCEDTHEECPDWAEEGECVSNAQFMLRGCRESCHACHGAVLDQDYGVEQLVPEEHQDEIEEAMEDMFEYFDGIREDPETSPIKLEMLSKCQNKDESCAIWKVEGECEGNPDFMRIKCPAICQNCSLVSLEERCPLDLDVPMVWGPGDLNKMFVNITTGSEFQKYQVNVLSRPDYINGDTEETANYKIGPWVVTLDNFLSNEEADRMVQLGSEEGYEQSADVGEMNPDGTFENDINTDRTSINSWCRTVCYEDPTAKKVMQKIEEVSGIPEANSEFIQMLKYDVGQFYKTHHDLINFDIDRQPGVRLLTIFLYLNDVEAGGGTNFPELDITVMPKKGRVLIWPSVVDEDPDETDGRTMHQALAVEAGVKYGANAWLHQRDYKEAEARECA